jgi:hypothetical protein
MKLALRIAPSVVLAVCACSVDPEEPELEELDTISLNALEPAALLNNGEALNALAGGGLDGATTGLVNSAQGRQLLSYVARCALATGDEVSFPRSGAPALVYPGVIGIAPGWKQSSIGIAGRRLMTACLMAHVNAVRTQVPISVRSATLREAPLTEKLLFPAQEMAVYGNVFAPPAEQDLFVCFGQAVAQSLGGSGGLGTALGLPTYLDFRMCSVSARCGFQRVGACYRWPSQPDVKKSACRVQSGNLYRNCQEGPIEDGSTPLWNDTVSVYLQPVDLALLLTEYVDLICDLTSGQLCEVLPL